MENQKKYDVVYVLGKGSPWDNNELRFSIRSLVKNLKGFRKIYVVGEKPSWIKKIIHIPYDDFFKNGQNNDGNIIKKVLRACEIPGLSNDFLFINDDHFIMKPINILDIPPYQKGDMTTFDAKYFELNFWRLRLWRTRNILIKKGYTAYHYDCHTPMLFNKKKFPNVISEFDYEKLQGYTIKSLYGNVVYGEGVPLEGNKKTIFRNYIYPDIVKKLEKSTFACVNDTGLNFAFKMYLHVTFPDRSIYENDTIGDSSGEIMNWFNSEKDYLKGCELYLKFGRNNNIKRFLMSRTARIGQKKLENHLLKIIN